MSPGEHASIWWATIIGAYVILWWLSFFVVLPIGMHNEDDPPGQFTLGETPKPKSEQTKPALSIPMKLLLATGISAVLWAVFYGLTVARIIQL